MGAQPLRLLLLAGCVTSLRAVGGEESVVHVLAELVVVLLAAKVGGELMERLGQPAVLGELLAGIGLSALAMEQVAGAVWLRESALVSTFAEMGAVLLLFEVGLETHFNELAEVGVSALIVALIGVAAPSLLGYAVSSLWLPRDPWYVHLFIGATLAATSVGITARVLKDLGCLDRKESRIILGAAVVDDVLGLIVLAVVSGLVTSIARTGHADFSVGPVLLIIVKSIAFLAAAIWLGRRLHLNLARWGARFRVPGVALVVALSHCFSLAALAGWVGLAPIVGAFAAGLVLEESDYDLFQQRGELPIASLIRPVAMLFVPVFFVMMGIRVDLRAVASVEMLGLAALLTVAAIAGKQACALGVRDRTLRRSAIGIGMIPRGEVGLIFVGLGASLTVGGKSILNPVTTSALIVMVILTTVVTPPLLKWSLGAARRK